MAGLLAQADAVLALTRWPRGHYLRALLRLEQLRQQGRPDLNPVVRDLCAAIALRPDYDRAHAVLADLSAPAHPLLALRLSERRIAFHGGRDDALSLQIERAAYLVRARYSALDD